MVVHFDDYNIDDYHERNWVHWAWADEKNPPRLLRGGLRLGMWARASNMWPSPDGRIGWSHECAALVEDDSLIHNANEGWSGYEMFYTFDGFKSWRKMSVAIFPCMIVAHDSNYF